MGCDAYANDDGVFEIEVRDYDDIMGDFGTRIIRIEGLRPRHKIDIEITEGEPR